MTSIIDKLEKRNLGKRSFFLVLGTLLGALAFNIFYRPYNVIPTGSTGFAFLLTQFIPIEVSIMTFIVNFILFIIGLFYYDLKYAIKYLIITIIYPIFLSSTLLMTSQINLEKTSLFLVMVFGGILSGLSSGLIRKSNFTPGGFSIIFDILYEKLHISIGTASLTVNLLMITFSGFIFGLNNALYAIIAMLVTSYVMDKVIIGISDNKVFYIVTRHPEDIKECIIENFHYNVTVVNTKNTRKKKMLMVVIPTIEHLALRETIKKIDEDAFFLIVDAYESSVKKNWKNV